MISTADPRVQLFATLISIVKEDKPQIPFERTQVPVQQYTDPKWFAHEWQSIFMTTPMIVGVSASIPEPGDYFTNDLLGVPLLIVRGKDHKIRCFFNVCRHRGVRLCNTESFDQTKTFSCPYHHWTYDLTGKLIFVPAEDSFPGLDRSCHTLKEVPVAEKSGLIWVSPFSQTEIDIESFLGNVAYDLDAFGLTDSKFFKQNIHHCKANWKLHIEAFQDTYHVTRLHNKSVGEFFRDNMAVQDRERDHLRSIVARKEIEHVLHEGPDHWDLRNHGSFAYLIWPNTTMIIHPDYISQVTFYPISEEETTIVHNCVIHEDTLSEKALNHYNRSFQLIDEGVFANEDFHVCQQAQIGLKSGANDFFTIGGYEDGIRQFHKILQEKAGAYRSL